MKISYIYIYIYIYIIVLVSSFFPTIAQGHRVVLYQKDQVLHSIPISKIDSIKIETDTESPYLVNTPQNNEYTATNHYRTITLEFNEAVRRGSGTIFYSIVEVGQELSYAQGIINSVEIDNVYYDSESNYSSKGVVSLTIPEDAIDKGKNSYIFLDFSVGAFIDEGGNLMNALEGGLQNAEDEIIQAPWWIYSKIEPVSLQGKQLVAMGNSITAPSTSWAYVVSKNLGMELTNFALSGAHWTDYSATQIDLSNTGKYWVNDSYYDYSNNTISNQVYRFLQMITPEGETIPETEGLPVHSGTTSLVGTKFNESTFDPYLIIISCGTNDSGQKELGDISELDKPYKEANRKNLYGAIRWATSVLRKYSPKSQIVLLTPIQRADGSDLPLPQFVEAIMLAAEKLGYPVINMYEESGIKEEEESIEHKYLYDGLHPNSNGDKLMGTVVTQYIESWCGDGTIK